MTHPLRSHGRRGFTLLEVLLALSLLTLLLLGLTSAIALHLRAFDTGRSDVTQAQLARALLERMAADLVNLTPAPAAAAAREPLPAAPRPSADIAAVDEAAVTPPSSLPGPAWVLSGERQHLRLVTRRGRLTWPTEEAAAGLDSPSSDGGLALVHYRWLAETETDAEAGETRFANGEIPQPGLTRVAAPWIPEVGDSRPNRAPGSGEGEVGIAQDSPLAERGATRPVRSTSRPAGSPERFTQPPSGTTTGADRPAGLAPLDLGELHVPEVADMALRYFDGRTWHASWPAPGSGPLPRAVEIRLALADPGEAQSWREAGGVFQADESLPTDSVDEGGNDVPGAASSAVTPPEGDWSSAPATSPPNRRAARSTIQVYRRVVILPAGSQPDERRPPVVPLVEPPAARSDFTP